MSLTLWSYHNTLENIFKYTIIKYISYTSHYIQVIWDKVFKNGSSKIWGRQPLKNLKDSNFLKAVFYKFLNTLSHIRVNPVKWNSKICIASVIRTIMILNCVKKLSYSKCKKKNSVHKWLFGHVQILEHNASIY